MIFGDPRPHPPVDEMAGAPWFPEYEEDWKKEFTGHSLESCFVREANGYWVWVTNTPMWDRSWFEARGWKFPTAWITGPSKTFYQIGSDVLSTVVSLPPKTGGSTLDKEETW
jgi:hypothetical protein